MMKLDYKDKDGNIISLLEWGRLFEDHNYRIIAQDKIGKLLISTVWLGVPHIMWIGENWCFEGYFETGIFTRKNSDKGIWRYPTLAQAIEGHRKIVDGLGASENEEVYIQTLYHRKGKD